ncbi:transmembrane protein 238 [Silurus meridionalis]|uniref:Transmembrane protein 238 n=1 Tax=Silurus asotus TaxID=30991 RepID=A0AAD5ATT7_SILAS|nr:transmembrane protein 238 [Silurus meridionalis]KAI5621624.1 transmembrane protein 238 [Silurus asotus]
MASCTGLAHCKVALAFAVIFDLVGVMVLLAGVFVPLEVKGRDFGDLLVYTGVILVLISLGGWVMWYSGNIEGLATSKEMGHIGNAVDRIARTLSRKMRIHRGHQGP